MQKLQGLNLESLSSSQSNWCSSPTILCAFSICFCLFSFILSFLGVNLKISSSLTCPESADFIRQLTSSSYSLAFFFTSSSWSEKTSKFILFFGLVFTLMEDVSDEHYFFLLKIQFSVDKSKLSLSLWSLFARVITSLPDDTPLFSWPKSRKPEGLICELYKFD